MIADCLHNRNCSNDHMILLSIPHLFCFFCFSCVSVSISCCGRLYWYRKVERKNKKQKKNAKNKKRKREEKCWLDGRESHAATSGAILQWMAVIFPFSFTKGLQGKPMNTSQQYAKKYGGMGDGCVRVCVCVSFFICHHIFINLNFFSVFFFHSLLASAPPFSIFQFLFYTKNC